VQNVKPTNSERVFVDLCKGLDLTVSKIPEDPSKKTPDFEVRKGKTKVTAEVKQHESEKAKQAKTWLDNNPRQFRSGKVDFENTGRMDRILRKQKDQLAESCNQETPTLAVVYPEETMGPTDYACQIQLERGLLNIPEEISAVLYLENEQVQYQDQMPKGTLFVNPDAKVQFPRDFFSAN